MTHQHNKNETDPKLIQSLKAGNPFAFREIFALYQRRLYGFTFSITKSQYISEEIIQEVFIKIWTQRETLDPERCFDSYIFTITRNLTYNYLRDAARRNSVRTELLENIKIQYEEVEEKLILAEYKEIINQIIDKLPSQKRLIYQLSKEQRKSNSEIGDILGISPKTVKNHLWNIMSTIRNQIEPYLDEKIPVSILFILLFF